MTSQQTAIEHLQVIRSLLEKAQIYRAISAPAALFGGVTALAAMALANQASGKPMTEVTFLVVWLGILAATTGLNFFLLYRDASHRGQPFFSIGMRTALRSFYPPMLAGGVLGIGLVVRDGNFQLGALIWIISYGLALLSTAHFSPRSLVRLGRAFLLTGLLLACLYFTGGLILGMNASAVAEASCYLGLTFGLLHVAYAMAVFIRRAPAVELPAA